AIAGVYASVEGLQRIGHVRKLEFLLLEVLGSRALVLRPVASLGRVRTTQQKRKSQH
ncbi:MAG: hypothetical protein ACJAYI_000346, partial [Myxococcota bacterium]